MAIRLTKTKRTPLKERPFPDYSPKEEFWNSISHAVGVLCAIVMMWMAIKASLQHQDSTALFCSIVYVGCVFITFLVSSIYHGLPKGMPKQVMRIVDHCDIFFTIAGTYTPIMLIGVLPVNPVMAWSIFIVEWVFAVIGATLNAIDLKKYSTFSMICYLAMGWCVIISLRDAVIAMTWPGFAYILGGGVAYTIGAVLYLIGKKKPYRHFVFHIFVLLAAIIQFAGIYLYLLR
ncbi:MAG: hemolysin III family protein [Bacteroidales bacterium]|nr:hemolysin III family protein [Bacteroidales bacterium]